ncbi:hypothetical protein GUJ93_ZPchr0009g1387 [Zizania palustris]|uniref:Uncharacterized protein n=1 Tax=Zizania palustris TaxID=103762 RepID=A0A8J5S6F3_ZIZPA|nr:hypothetical protein GUJ93_ZPchr0009g1387 [Zizania palustris]
MAPHRPGGQDPHHRVSSSVPAVEPRPPCLRQAPRCRAVTSAPPDLDGRCPAPVPLVCDPESQIRGYIVVDYGCQKR